jgi:cytochrome c biogenesis protein ResB
MLESFQTMVLPHCDAPEMEIIFSDMMFFTQINDDIVIDQIPLAEINRVKEMEAVDKEIDKAANENQLMIETHPEGYNSGRTYYLQAESRASCQDKIKMLLRISAAAYERAHAQSVFRQAQLRVLKVYRSIFFQRFMAFLIISVSDIAYAPDPAES